MVPLSILDLSPVPEGSNTGQALRNSIDLARHAEALGFRRYWMAEHHNLPGIASAATAVALAHVAVATDTIRIGAGGIMLPNHAPLLIAEQFGTLAALDPGLQHVWCATGCSSWFALRLCLTFRPRADGRCGCDLSRALPRHRSPR